MSSGTTFKNQDDRLGTAAVELQGGKNVSYIFGGNRLARRLK